MKKRLSKHLHIRGRVQHCKSGGAHSLALSGEGFRVWPDATGTNAPLLECGQTVTNGAGATFLAGTETDLYVEAVSNGTATLTYRYAGGGAASNLACSAALKMPAVKITFDAMQGNEHEGFEPESTIRSEGPHAWASVGKNSTSDVVRILIEPEAAASMVELVAVSGADCVDISPKYFNTGTEGLVLTGMGQDGNAVIEARIKNTSASCGSLNVMSLSERASLSVGVYRIWDSTSPMTALPSNGPPSDTEIVTAMNACFKQAQITFEVDVSSGV